MQSISSTPLFSNLNAKQLQDLQSLVQPRNLKRDELIFMEGDVAFGLFVVATGKVKIFRIGADGREVILHVLRPGQLFAEVPALQGGRYPASAQAIESSTIMVLSRDDLVKTISKDPDLALGMLASLSQRLKELVDKVESLTLREASQRLAAYLLYMAEATGSENRDFDLDVSRSLLAGMLGSARETISRGLTRLEEAGVIKMEGRRVYLLDLDYLQKLASGMEKL